MSMTGQEIFLTRLRRQRERSGVTLDAIARSSRVRVDMLEALEQGDLSAWPKGLYARSWIHSYARAIGVDPVEVVDEFCRLFPHGDRRVQSTMNELAAIVDVVPRPTADESTQSLAYGRRASDIQDLPPRVSLPARLACAIRVIAEVRRVRELPGRLAQYWRLFRPSPPTF